MKTWPKRDFFPSVAANANYGLCNRKNRVPAGVGMDSDQLPSLRTGVPGTSDHKTGGVRFVVKKTAKTPVSGQRKASQTLIRLAR